MASRIDFNIAERVWDNIRSNTDVTLANNVDAVHNEFVRLRDRLQNDKSALYSMNVAENRIALSVEISCFVSRAYMFYAALKNVRDFSPEEKQLGKELASFHEEGMNLVQL